MRKSLMTAVKIAMCFLASLAHADGLKGIYSCSSGDNNDRPVTYVFNTSLMDRNDNKSAPFEYLASLSDGRLLYIGETEAKIMDSTSKIYGLKKEHLKDWVAVESMNISEVRYSIDSILEQYKRKYGDTDVYNQIGVDDHYPNLVRALACELKERSYYDNYGKDTCQKELDIAEKLNISDLQSYFVDLNRRRQRTVRLVDKILVTVDLKTAQVHEAFLDKQYLTKTFNCSVLNIEVPAIKPPENAIKAST